jgi:hypothetical protein
MRLGKRKKQNNGTLEPEENEQNQPIEQIDSFEDLFEDDEGQPEDDDEEQNDEKGE